MKRYSIYQCCLVIIIGFTGCSKEATLVSKVKEQAEKASGNASEQANSLLASSVVSYSKDVTTPITTLDCTPGYVKKIGYSIGPLTVAAADVVSAHLQREITYSGSSNVMVACGIVVATSPTAIDNTSAGYLGMLSPFCGSNLNTPYEGNIEILTRTGSYKFAAASNSIYINAVFYGASLGEGLDVTFPAGNNYGELVAVVERGIQRYSSTVHHSPFVSGFGYSVPTGGTLYVDNSIGPLNVAAGTMVDIRYQVEATAEIASGGATQMLGRQTILGTSAAATSGTVFTKASLHGIQKYEHHDVSSHAGGNYFSTAVSNGYFNSVVYSYGGSGNPLLIEDGGAAGLLYGHYIVETRPYVGFAQDFSRNITSVTSTPQVLYSVGPIDIDANQVVEVRYVGTFGAPSSIIPFRSYIVRATSATGTTGFTVQPALYRKYGPSYVNNNAIHSTAERPSTAVSGQYYNVVVSLPSGGSLPVMDWGELEVVKR